jgi:hypothetical protein
MRERKRRYKMADLLMKCFFDGMKKQDAIIFIEKSYGKKVLLRSIKIADEKIKKYYGKIWE